MPELQNQNLITILLVLYKISSMSYYFVQITKCKIVWYLVTNIQNASCHSFYLCANCVHLRLPQLIYLQIYVWIMYFDILMRFFITSENNCLQIFKTLFESIIFLSITIFCVCTLNNLFLKKSFGFGLLIITIQLPLHIEYNILPNIQ